MHRIDTTGKADDLFGAGRDGFTDGSPGSGIPPTYLDDDWFNAVGESLARVVEDAGAETLTKNDHDQVARAITYPAPLVPRMTADSNSAASTSLTAFEVTASIPADRLRAGSVVRITAIARHTVNTSGSGTVQFRLRFNGSTIGISTTETIQSAAPCFCIFSALVTFRTIGATGQWRAATQSVHAQSGLSATPQIDFVSGSTANTEAPIVVSAAYDLSNASDQVALEQLVVELL